MLVSFLKKIVPILLLALPLYGQQIDLTKQVKGVLPVANGGTNSSTPASTTVNTQVCALGSSCSITAPLTPGATYLNDAAYLTTADGIMSTANVSTNTVTCTATCNFTNADIGKEILGFTTCMTNYSGSPTDVFPAGTVISGVSSGTVVTTSLNATAPLTGGCIVWGTNNDTILSTIDTALSTSIDCPTVTLPAGMMIVDKPHFFAQPPGCFLGSAQAGGSVGGGGFTVIGRGVGSSVLMLGNGFYSNIATLCVNGLFGGGGGPGTACFCVPKNGNWFNWSIQGGGESLSGKSWPHTSGLVEADDYAVISHWTGFNYGAKGASSTMAGILPYVVLGGPVWMDHVLLDGFGNRGIGTPSGTSVYGSFMAIEDYCGTFVDVGAGSIVEFTGGENLVLPGPCTNAFASLISVEGTFISQSGLVMSNANNATNANQMIVMGANTGIARINGALLNVVASPSGSYGINNTKGGKVILRDTTVNAATAANGYYVGSSGGVTGGSLIIGDNVDIAGFTFATQATVQSSGKSMNGICTGTVPASSTIGFYGSGPNVTSTACATTVGLGITMDHAGTAYLLISTASAGGVNASSGAATALLNGSTQTMTATLGTGTFIADGLHTFTFAPGDRISCQMTTQGSDTLANPTCTIYWK